MRGPFRFIHNPPKNAAKPSTKMLMVKVRVTCEILHPNCFDNGTRKTLKAYTAPRAIWRNMPAIAMVQRLAVFIISFGAAAADQSRGGRKSIRQSSFVGNHLDWRCATQANPRTFNLVVGPAGKLQFCDNSSPRRLAKPS